MGRHRMGDHTSKGTLLYAVSVPPLIGTHRYLWGRAEVRSPDPRELGYSCFRAGREHALILSPGGTVIGMAKEWFRPAMPQCLLPKTFVIHVFDLEWGIPEGWMCPESSVQFDDPVFVAYSGPWTLGRVRGSGPWG